MRIKKLLFPLLLICSALFLVYRAFSKPAKSKPVSKSDSYDAVDAFIDKQMRRLKVPGASLAIVDGEQIVHQRGFGRARPGGAEPTPQTAFYIASLTKSFTALAVMQLVEDGKVDLDARVQRYLPWFRVADPQASAQITVRHLLNQTSGLPTSAGELPLTDFDDSPGATERQMRALSALEIFHTPGSTFEYSNANYNLLGLIIEVASGESYEDYIQRHIFTPLDMIHSTASPAAVNHYEMAAGYRYWFTVPLAAPNMPIPHGSLPGGLIISSAEDMARYLILHLNGGRYRDVQIVSSASIDELHQGKAEFVFMGASLGHYAMGWYVDKIGQSRLVWHSGILPHFFAYMALLPEQNKGVVLLFNVDHHWMSFVLTQIGTGVTALIAGEPPQPAPIPVLSIIPWVLRGLLLIPAYQIVDVARTIRLLRRWQLDPESLPSGRKAWGPQLLLPLIFNILPAAMLRSMLGKRRDYLMLYVPDYSWIAMVSGGFSLLWSIVRTGLVVRELRRESLP